MFWQLEPFFLLCRDTTQNGTVWMATYPRNLNKKWNARLGFSCSKGTGP